MRVCLASGERKAELLFIRLQKKWVCIALLLSPVCLLFSFYLYLHPFLSLSLSLVQSAMEYISLSMRGSLLPHFDKILHTTSLTFTHTWSLSLPLPSSCLTHNPFCLDFVYISKHKNQHTPLYSLTYCLFLSLTPLQQPILQLAGRKLT